MEPEPGPLVEGEYPLPYILIGDNAVPLKNSIEAQPMRNMTQEECVYTCNYRLSSARRVVENAFEILAGRFRCLINTYALAPEKVSSIVMICCVLGNILRERNPGADTHVVDHEDPETHQVISGQWRQRGNLADGHGLVCNTCNLHMERKK